MQHFLLDSLSPVAMTLSPIPWTPRSMKTNYCFSDALKGKADVNALRTSLSSHFLAFIDLWVFLAKLTPNRHIFKRDFFLIFRRKHTGKASSPWIWQLFLGNDTKGKGKQKKK